MTVLPLAYLGSVQYYTKLCFTDCVVDVHEHYIKQSMRNRCTILAAGGPADLTVPVARTPNDAKLSVRDTRIDYSRRWQHRHWTSLESAYRASPYFDHYADSLAPFFEKRWDFLYDLNAGLTAWMLEKLGCGAELRFSDGYITPGAEGVDDLRHSLSAKPRLGRPDPAFRAEPYYQVFSDRMPFAPNLSAADLLFCEGPHALGHLKNCIAP